MKAIILFECSICGDDKNERNPISIDGYEVCRGCVVTGIVPQFREALKYETKYPVKWSEGVELSPERFVHCFEDCEVFYAAWTRKIAEYGIPQRHRLYCGTCEKFLGLRSENLDGDPAYCTVCQTRNCSACVQADHASLECMEEDLEVGGQDPLQGVEGVKRCTNEDCNQALSLGSGCNSFKFGVCKQKFCWPGAANAIHDEVPTVEADDGDDLLMEPRAILHDPDLPPWADALLLYPTFRPNDAEILEDVRILMQVPMPSRADFQGTHAEAIIREQERVDLDSATHGILMIQDVGIINEMLGELDMDSQPFGAHGFVAAEFREFLHALRSNLDRYAYLVRVVSDLPDYEANHVEVIVNFVLELQRTQWLLTTYPGFFSMLTRYLSISETRIGMGRILRQDL